jgi:hypothetical protein
MAAGAEAAPDRREVGEDLPRLLGRLEALHRPCAAARGAVGGLGPVVHPLVPPVLDAR